ncbi:hypothetical protein ACLOJK_008972 [Asimina triloba]
MALARWWLNVILAEEWKYIAKDYKNEELKACLNKALKNDDTQPLFNVIFYGLVLLSIIRRTLPEYHRLRPSLNLATWFSHELPRKSRQNPEPRESRADMLRSAAMASAGAALRLVAASCRPSILHRPLASADPMVRGELLLTLNSVPRLHLEFSRSYARGRDLGYEEEFEEDGNEDVDEENLSKMEGFDHDDFDDDDHDFNDDEGDGET